MFETCKNLSGSTTKARRRGHRSWRSVMWVVVLAIAASGAWGGTISNARASSGAAAVLTTPSPNSTLNPGTVTFSWTTGTGVSQYWLYVGTTGVGSSNVANNSTGTATSLAGVNLSAVSGTLFVRLYSNISGAWTPKDYTYTVSSSGGGSGGSGGTTTCGTGTQPAVLTTPTPGSTLAQGSTTFSWTAGCGVSQYWLYVGTSGAGSSNVANTSTGTATSLAGVNLSAVSGNLFVRLYSNINGAWAPNDYTYTVSSSVTTVVAGYVPNNVPYLTQLVPTAYFVNPNGTTTAHQNVGINNCGPASIAMAIDFWYPNAATVDQAAIAIRGYDSLYYGPNATGTLKGNTTTDFTGKSPTGVATQTFLTKHNNLSEVPVTNSLKMQDQIAKGNPVVVLIDNSKIIHNSLPYPDTNAFTDSAHIVVVTGFDGTNYYINDPLSVDYSVHGKNFPVLKATFEAAAHDGTANWSAVAIVKGTSGTGTPASITIPTPGSTLRGNSVTFGWNPGSGVLATYLFVGTNKGNNNLFNAYVTGTSQTVSGLPTNGSTVWVELRSQLSTGWTWTDISYTTANGTGTPATITTPAPGSTLSGNSVTFGWNPGSGVSQYVLWAGTTSGQHDVYGSPVLTSTSAVADLTKAIPGKALYVTLWSALNGAWVSQGYTYTFGSGCTDAAALDSTSGSATLTPGQTTHLVIRVKNTGTCTWTAAGGYGYATNGPWAAKWGTGAIWKPVAPSDVVVFEDDIVAPQAPGTYSYGFQLTHNGSFGPNFSVLVHVVPQSSLSTPTLTVYGADPNNTHVYTINVSWAPVAGATGYRVWNGLASTYVTGTSTTYSGLASGTYMCFQMLAYNANQTSSWSTYSCVTTGNPPGGVWYTYPSAGTTESGDFPVYVRGYPASGGVAIDHVNFTLSWPSGTWLVSCVATTPITADVYACDYHIGSVPYGQFTISFDVYDVHGMENLSPNGPIVLYKGTSSVS